ncbi:MAG: penicillin-binding protein 2, partial [Leptolyngbyaceae cyanobacterium SL_7_1]|nr:penicillin-binding protein 2 [Leptolyngbyaceae cyanobacterium SL_7_1]
MTLTQQTPVTLAYQSHTRTVGRRYQSVAVMILITVLMVAGIGGRLAYLQLVQGERHRQLADNNRI